MVRALYRRYLRWRLQNIESCIDAAYDAIEMAANDNDIVKCIALREYVKPLQHDANRYRVALIALG